MIPSRRWKLSFCSHECFRLGEKLASTFRHIGGDELKPLRASVRLSERMHNAVSRSASSMRRCGAPSFVGVAFFSAKIAGMASGSAPLLSDGMCACSRVFGFMFCMLATLHCICSTQLPEVSDHRTKLLRTGPLRVSPLDEARGPLTFVEF